MLTTLVLKLSELKGRQEGTPLDTRQRTKYQMKLSGFYTIIRK